jgi:TonB family protein
MTRSALVRVASFVLAIMTLPAAPSGYKKWLNEDVVYIITDAERAEFLKLSTDDQRDKFIKQFWQYREPPPGAPPHNAKAEHYRRIAFANEHFGTASGTPGWKTDRGHLYIIFGPPDEITSHPSGVQFVPIPFELWDYRHVEGLAESINFDFMDPLKNGDYHLAWNPLMDRNTYGVAIRVGANVQEHNLVTKIEPIYPALAMWAHIQGTVRLTVIIGKDGRVFKIRRISGHRLLVAAARNAVRQWVYKPVLLGGEPVEVHTDVDVNFSLPAK